MGSGTWFLSGPASLDDSTHRLNFPLWVYCCVLASGAAGLMYEVVWARMLSLFIGSTGYAHSAVITAFMTGLALGSYLLGRYANQIKRPVIAYAWLEILLGIYAICTPFLYSHMQELYGQFALNYGIVGYQSQLLRYFIALGGLLIPTFLMGGTLPLLVQGLTRSLPATSKSMARLYGLNTLGAMLGTFCAGYLLIPIVGLKATIFSAVAINLLVGGVVLIKARALADNRFTAVSGTADQAASGINTNSAITISAITPRAMQAVLLGFALSGFAAMLYQLVWIKSLVLMIGGSVQAFTIILTTFLAGLGAGSYWWSKRDNGQPLPRIMCICAALQCGIAIVSLFSLLGFRYIPELFVYAFTFEVVRYYPLLQGLIFLFSFSLIFVPTLLMGFVFPMISGSWARHKQQVGHGIGTAYAVNAVGTILGASVGGLVLLPKFGIEYSLFIAAGLSCLIGVVFWLAGSATFATGTRLAGALLIILLPILITTVLPRWDNLFMQKGAFMYGAKVNKKTGSWFNYTRQDKLLYYGEGVDAVVSVTEKTQRSLKVNGKTDASTRSDLRTQLLIGHIPMMLHPQPEQALVVGLGSGATAAAVSKHQVLKSLDVVELSEKVIEASAFFTEINDGVLKHPKVQLHRADGRNFLHASDTHYDVIASEPSNPWQSGTSKLFTKEYYELLAGRIKPNGVVAQWVQIYSMAEHDVATLMATFQQVFKHVTVWRLMAGDLLLVGSKQALIADFDRVNGLFTQAELAQNLGRADVENVEDFVGVLLGPLSAFPDIQQYPRINTDDLPLVEYSAPRYLYTNTINRNSRFLMQSLKDKRFAAPLSGLLSQRDGEVHIQPIQLQIKNLASARGLSSTWFTDRVLVEVNRSRSGIAGRNQIETVWTDNNADYRLQSTFPRQSKNRSNRSKPDMQKAVLRELGNKIVTQGQLHNPLLGQVSWAVGPAKSEGQTKVVIGWACPPETAGSSPLNHVASLVRAGVSAADHEQVVSQLVDRFACRANL